MTGQAKQTEPRCEVIPGAGQTRMKIWEEDVVQELQRKGGDKAKASFREVASE